LFSSKFRARAHIFTAILYINFFLGATTLWEFSDISAAVQKIKEKTGENLKNSSKKLVEKTSCFWYD
jgi:hypothetical protein